MEILIFALVAAYNGTDSKSGWSAEPEEFQLFDLQAVRNPTKAEPPGQWQTGLGVHEDDCSFPAEANG
jgi:hypothetical protein